MPCPHDVWKSGTITSILTNPIYTGHTVYNRRESLNGRHRSLDRKEWILSEKANPDIVIIDEDTWNKVQKKRELRSRKYIPSLNNDVTVIKRNDGMLSLVDVLHCGYCGCKMVNGSKYNYWTVKGTKERRTSKIAIYKCQNAWQGVPHEKTKQFRAEEIEPVVYEALTEFISKLQENENIYEQIFKNQNMEKQKKEQDLKTAKKELEKIRRGIRVMEEHIPEAMTGECPLKLEDLVRNIDIQKEKERVQLTIVQEKETVLQNTSVSVKNWEKVKCRIPTWREVFLDADRSVKRVLVNKLIERIDITRELVIIYFKISPGEFLPKSRIIHNKVVPEQGL